MLENGKHTALARHMEQDRLPTPLGTAQVRSRVEIYGVVGKEVWAQAGKGKLTGKSNIFVLFSLENIEKCVDEAGMPFGLDAPMSNTY